MTTDTADRAALEREVEAYMTRPYVMHVVWDEDYWAATFPELPGLVAAADTLGELEQKIHDAKWSYFEAALEAGLPIAEPGGGGEPASGRVLLRLPKSLHRQVARAAGRDGVSVNTFLIATIAKELGRGEPHGLTAPTARAYAQSGVTAQFGSGYPAARTSATPAPGAGGEPEFGVHQRGGRRIKARTIEEPSGESHRRTGMTPEQAREFEDRLSDL